jgi:PadR family transcriptional regulator PadR
MPGQGRGRGGRGAGGRGRGLGPGRGRGRRRLLEPVLLLQLKRGASHGYGLLEGLEEFDLGLFDPSVIYRLLREMEGNGWISSTWDEKQTQGPPRRVYQINAEGEGVLQQWTKDLEQGRSRIDRFLRAYKKLNE